MKKLIVVLMLAGIALGQAKPKWHNPDAWRRKLRPGLTAKTIPSILGKPAYVHITWPTVHGTSFSSVSKARAMRAIWYYGVPPMCVPVKGTGRNPTKAKLKLRYRQFAKVVCEGETNWDITGGRRQRPDRPKYRITKWAEPDWSNLGETKVPPKSIKKRRLLRKPKKWEMPRVWKKLMVGMPIAAVHRFIGGAEVEVRERDSKQWHFGTVLDCGVLAFHNNYLYRWSEPFWPEVDKTLYAPHESKRAE